MGLLSATANAQTFHGSLRTSASGVPVAGAIVLLVDSLHDVRARARSDDRGRFDLTASATEPVRLRIQRIGSRPYESLPFVMRGDTSAVISLDQLPALTLPAVTSTAQSACRGRGLAAEANWEVWEDVKTALLATSLTYAEQRSRFRLAQVTRIYDFQAPRLRDIALLEDSVAATQPWTSFAPDLLAEHGYVRYADGRLTFVSPDLDVLLSRSFENTHCFESGLLRDGPLIGLAFDPAARPRGHADIAGVFWIDATSRELRKLTFNYVGLPPMGDSTGTSLVAFATFAQHEWFIASWTIRSPLPVIVTMRAVPVAEQLRMFGDLAEGRDDRPIVWRLGGVKERHGAVLSVHRTADSLNAKAVWSSPTGSINVVVRHGAAARGAQSPLAGAEVRLEGSGRQRVTTDSGGAVFEGLTSGDYKVSVSSPINLLLGEKPVIRYVHVDSQALTPLSVTMQTPIDVANRRCGPRRRVVVGTVTLNGQPVSDALVRAHDVSGSPDDSTRVSKPVKPNTDGQFMFCLKDVTSALVEARTVNGLEASAVALFSPESPIVVVDLTLAAPPGEKRP
ncbi:MAG TPA: carboxypeptidase-like regulatory domain-containing protein [Gemmatimonadaceae bacterium]